MKKHKASWTLLYNFMRWFLAGVFRRLRRLYYISLYYKNLTLPCYSMQEAINLSSKTNKITYLNTNQTINLPLPQILNTDDYRIDPKHECIAKLPDTYLATLKNTTIFGGTNLIIIDDNLAVCDEIALNEKRNETYGIRSGNIISISASNILTIQTPRRLPQSISTGIHLVNDHSANYYHWLVECLPRLSLVKDLDANIPLLVDQDLPKQYFEALELLNISKRPIIFLTKNTPYKVETLYYPSLLSNIYDNYGPPNYKIDAVFSKGAISFIKNSVLDACQINPDLGYRKLYISRKTSSYRKILNEDEVENLLIKEGFEIIFPEHLSFFAQVKLFSEAKIVVGQSGAGMTNFIFTPPNCQVIMMMSDAPDSNLNIFNALAHVSGTEIEFFIGKAYKILAREKLHYDFLIDIEKLTTYIRQYK